MYKSEKEGMKKEKQAMEQRYQSNIRNGQIEKESLVSQHQQEIDLIKHNHQQEVEMLKSSHQSDRQTLQQRQEFQLRALEEEHRKMKQAMEQQHQAQLESKVSEMSAKDALISSKASSIKSLQLKLGQTLGTSSGKDNLSVFSPGVKLTFTECARTPTVISGLELDQSIVIGKNVYVGVDSDGEVFNYSITEEGWSTLPVTPVKLTGIGYIYKKLLLIGGRLPSNQVTADIHEFVEASQQWVRSTSIPPMPTARSSATAVSWSSPPALIVCGGNSQQINPMTVVEIYHSRTSQWHAVTPLPFPRALMSHTLIHNMLYLVGGCEGKAVSTYKKRVMTISIPQLLGTCLQPSPVQWKCLPISNIPNYWSTAASLGGCLMVVGGLKELVWPPTIVSSVHAYCPFTSSWVLVGQLPQPLYSCITATLPTGELLVIGGMTSDDRIKASNTTYKCSLSM